MGNYRDEIERFIYEICYKPIWTAVSDYVSQHLSLLDLTYSRIKYPDSAFVEDMLLEFTKNIRIDGDSLLFDAVVSCTMNLTEDNYRGYASCDLNQWFLVSCEAVIKDKLESLNIVNVQQYTPGLRSQSAGQTVSKNIVPILYKKDLEDEAAAFLEHHYPEALEKPMPVPITEIAESMGLSIVEGHRITDDFSIFGEIYFSPGKAEVYDLFQCTTQELEVQRGTILIDAYTYWERNLGCVKNTIAHEVYHWYKHRMYAAIRYILYGRDYVACRCPSNMVYPGKDDEWTDEQRMEWQANSMAPRILMPLRTFQMKVDELYKQYDYANSSLKIAVLTCIADDLAKFYGVSRQSALIRMMETGYKEAASVYNYDSDSPFHNYVSQSDAFYAYCADSEFRKLVDSGLFRYVNGYFAIDDEQFISKDENGTYALTDYAWSHLSECTLQFSWQTVRPSPTEKRFPDVILHRTNADRKVSKYDAGQNSGVIKMSEELRRKREEFERQNAVRQIAIPQKTCWELIFEILQARGMSKSHFCSVTGLGEEVYRKAEKNIDTRPTMRTIIAIARGLDLDISTTEKLMQLAGHAFDESDEHRALRFCVTGFPGGTIEEANEFLESYDFKPLGTQERY
ncbi:MAG: ImmA/IrrE family metallo-endopeptidase [Candidatus Faecousia sp.]|nr:ImmA/IrrE family metallo-endopeptidase [Candidatus Faecousia sp.]